MNSSKYSASINSDTIGNPVASLAATRISNPADPIPWKAYGDVLGLNAPPLNRLAPAALAAANAALLLLQTQASKYLDSLRANSRLMRRLLLEGGLNVVEGITPIIPVVIGEAGLTMQFADRLKSKGILVSGIRPPTVPRGESRLRITVTAAHCEEQLRQAAQIITALWQELKHGEKKEG